MRRVYASRRFEFQENEAIDHYIGIEITDSLSSKPDGNGNLLMDLKPLERRAIQREFS